MMLGVQEAIAQGTIIGYQEGLLCRGPNAQQDKAQKRGPLALSNQLPSDVPYPTPQKRLLLAYEGENTSQMTRSRIYLIP